MKKTIIALIITLIITLNLIYLSYWNSIGFEVLNNKDDNNLNTNAVVDIQSYIYNISIQQIQIWHKIETTKKYTWEINPEMIEILSNLKYYAYTDIITLLDISKNKKETLDRYLSESNNTIEKSDYFKDNLELEIEDNISRFEWCSKEKSSSDKDYFQALERQDAIIMDTSIYQSKKADECISKNRIDANSKKALLSKIIFFSSILEEKYNFLYTKQDMIINNFQIIKTDIAGELAQITEILNQYQVE